ncbi:3-oxoacyl-ACP synthase III family protein [Anaerocolumna xylanovorans]|nr:ketoacyl-ACP synthase III [Anaerocolumna xylanovorans]
MNYIAKLVGVGQALPERVVTSEEMEAMMGFDQLGIRKGMAKILSGVSERRFASDEINSSDLAVEAAKEAMEMAGKKAEDIDLVIFSALTQDVAEPATANIIMDKLNIRNAKSFDIKNACNAFVCAIEIANMYIKCNDVKNVLIASGEVLSRFVKMDLLKDPAKLKDVNSTFSVGDGGGAIVLERQESEEDFGIITAFRTFPDTWSDGVLWGGGTIYPHDPDKFYFQNESEELMKINFKRAMKFFEEQMEKMKIVREEIDLFIPTQITKYIIIKSSEVLKLPDDRVVSQIGTLGNMSTASIPVALSRAVNSGQLKIGTGQKVVLLGVANGFNVGLVYMSI